MALCPLVRPPNTNRPRCWEAETAVSLRASTYPQPALDSRPLTHPPHHSPAPPRCGADPGARDSDRNTALHIAAADGNLSAVGTEGPGARWGALARRRKRAPPPGVPPARTCSCPGLRLTSGSHLPPC
jgi:hypothetical protein